MNIIVTSYTRSRKAAKATIRYIKHRPNKEGERVSRPLFDFENLVENLHAYQMIDGAPKGSTFYRVAFAPDPNKEDANKDLDLRWLTQVAMQYLKKQLGKNIQFAAAEHNDQTANRHVNTLIIVPGRLTKMEFRAFPKHLRTASTAEAKLQREMLDPQPEAQAPAQVLQTPQAARGGVEQLSQEEGGSAPANPLHTCPDCGRAQSLWRVGESAYKCPGCGSQFAEVGINGGLQREGVQLSL